MRVLGQLSSHRQRKHGNFDAAKQRHLELAKRSITRLNYVANARKVAAHCSDVRSRESGRPNRWFGESWYSR